jgi:DNA-binding PadR family transcriptional regulator
VLNDMRGNIKKALFDEQLGPIDGAIRSATEIVERQADFSRRVGAAFGRLQAELVHPVIRRTIHILKKKGLIEIPQVDGREIRIQAQSPLGNAQQQQEILNIDRWMEMMQVRMGPQITQLMVKQEETAAKLADLFGVPSDLVRDDSERAKIVQEIASAAGQATQAGADPNDLANGLNQAIAPSGGGVVQ